MITSDRDEKIRSSRFPNSYNIDTYLLGHKEFVIQIGLIDDSDRLVSASGDSRIILWSLSKSSILQDLQLTDLIDPDELARRKQANLKGIDRFVYDTHSQRLLVHLFGARFLMQFAYDPEGLFKFTGTIDIGVEISWFAHIRDDIYLFMSLDDGENTSVFRLKRIQKLDDDSVEFHGLGNQLTESIRIENRRIRTFLFLLLRYYEFVFKN